MEGEDCLRDKIVILFFLVGRIAGVGCGLLWESVGIKHGCILAAAFGGQPSRRLDIPASDRPVRAAADENGCFLRESQ